LIPSRDACYGLAQHGAASSFVEGGPTHREGEMSKVKMLIDAGLVDEEELTDEHKEMIEKEITIEEIDVIVRVGKKFSNHPSVLNKKVGCAF
jgi:hypothetical protein